MYSLPPISVKDVIRDRARSGSVFWWRTSVNGLDNAAEAAQVRDQAPCFNLIKSVADSSSLLSRFQDGGVWRLGNRGEGTNR
jgi:hypothetical protein